MASKRQRVEIPIKEGSLDDELVKGDLNFGEYLEKKHQKKTNPFSEIMENIGNSVVASGFFNPSLKQATKQQEELISQINIYEQTIYSKAFEYFRDKEEGFNLSNTRDFLDTNYDDDTTISEAIDNVFQLNTNIMGRKVILDPNIINDNRKIQYVFDIVTKDQKDYDYTIDTIDDATVVGLNWIEKPQPHDVEEPKGFRSVDLFYADEGTGVAIVKNNKGQRIGYMSLQDLPATNEEGKKMFDKNIRGIGKGGKKSKRKQKKYGGKKSKKQRKSRRTKRRH